MMNEEQDVPENALETEQDSNKIFLGDSSLQSKGEFESDKANEDYYAVDDPKKGAVSNIGDGEMRDEGTVGMGNIAEESRFTFDATGESDED